MDKFKNVLYFAVGLLATVSVLLGWDAGFNNSCALDSALNLGVDACEGSLDAEPLE